MPAALGTGFCLENPLLFSPQQDGFMTTTPARWSCPPFPRGILCPLQQTVFIESSMIGAAGVNLISAEACRSNQGFIASFEKPTLEIVCLLPACFYIYSREPESEARTWIRAVTQTANGPVDSVRRIFINKRSRSRELERKSEIECKYASNLAM